MNPFIDGFTDELTKLAGIGFNIHGYSISPKKLDALRAQGDKEEKEYSKWYQASKSVTGERPMPTTKRPGFFSRVFLQKKPTRVPVDPEAMSQYESKLKAYKTKNPAPKYKFGGSWEARQASQVKTPYDRESSRWYKLHGRMMGLQDMVTDYAYASKPINRPISKKELPGVIAKYKKELAAGSHAPEARKGGQAFINKATALLKNPKVKFVRLEME